jgi:hypothetical protein
MPNEQRTLKRSLFTMVLVHRVVQLRLLSYSATCQREVTPDSMSSSQWPERTLVAT